MDTTIAPPTVTMIPRECLEPWPRLNPRTHFDEGELQELADSLKIDGIQEPILVVVCPPDLHLTDSKVTALTTHLIYAGERRWRASWIAELEELPCIVRDIDEATAHRIALVENLQRANLGPIEEARGLQRYIEVSGKTQKDVGESLGYTQAWVANRLRLLQLPAFVLDVVESRLISATAARDAFLPFTRLRDPEVRHDLFGNAISAIRKLKAPTDADVERTVLKVAMGMSHSIREGWDYGGGRSVQVSVTPKIHEACGCGGPSLKYGGQHDEKGSRCFDAKWWKEANAAAGAKLREKQEKARGQLAGAKGGVNQWKPTPPKLDKFDWPDRDKVIPQKTVEKRGLRHDSLMLLPHRWTPYDVEAFDPSELPADKVVKIQTGKAFDLICLDADAVTRARAKAEEVIEQRYTTRRRERANGELEVAREKGHGVGFALTVLLSNTESIYEDKIERAIGDLYPERYAEAARAKAAEESADVFEEVGLTGLNQMTEEEVANVAIVLATRVQNEVSGQIVRQSDLREEVGRELLASCLAQLKDMVPGELPEGEPEEPEEEEVDPGEAGDGRLAVDGEAEDEPVDQWRPAGVGAGAEGGDADD